VDAAKGGTGGAEASEKVKKIVDFVVECGEGIEFNVAEE
jgi:hypothetical protein